MDQTNVTLNISGSGFGSPTYCNGIVPSIQGNFSFATWGCNSDTSYTITGSFNQGNTSNYTAYVRVGQSNQYPITVTPYVAPDSTAPSVPTGLSATAISSSQINLSWTASTDPDSPVSGYNIYRCSGSGCTPTTLIGTSAVNSFNNSGLSPATTYGYAVSAYDAVPNTSSKSTTVYQSTPALAPPTVTTNAASSLTSSSATLNGSANPNGSATTGWFRYSATNPGSCNDSFGTRVPASGGASLGSGSSAVAYSNSVSGLTIGTTYYYCAIASNGGGTAFGSVVSFVPPDTTAPTPPTVSFSGAWTGAINFTLAGPGGSQTFTALPTSPSPLIGQAVGSYTLTYNSGGPSGATLTSISPCGTGVNPCTQSLSGGSTISFTLNFNNTPPSPGPVTMAVTPQNACKVVNVFWGSSSGAAGYNVQRCGDANCSLSVPTPVCSVTTPAPPGTACTDSSAPDGTPLWYRVNAYNAFGTSAWSYSASSITNNAPNVSFSYAPSSNIRVGQLVAFSGALINGNAATSQSWAFAGGTPSSSTSASPSASFGTSGSHTVTYTANNASGSCVVSNPVSVLQNTFGDWCEIPPDAPPGTACP